MMSHLTDFDLDIPFKGKRDYLQSADVYGAVLSKLAVAAEGAPLNDVKMLFRSMARKRLRAILNSGGAEDEKAVITCRIGGEQVRVSLVETAAEVLERREYPEEKIVGTCSLDLPHQAITCPNSQLAEFSLIEVIVAMNKALHLAAFPSPSRKWLFTEVRTKNPLLSSDWGEVKIFIKSKLGTKLTRSTILLEGEDVGYLCFSPQN